MQSYKRIVLTSMGVLGEQLKELGCRKNKGTSRLINKAPTSATIVWPVIQSAASTHEPPPHHQHRQAFPTCPSDSSLALAIPASLPVLLSARGNGRYLRQFFAIIQMLQEVKKNYCNCRKADTVINRNNIRRQSRKELVPPSIK